MTLDEPQTAPQNALQRPEATRGGRERAQGYFVSAVSVTSAVNRYNQKS